MIKAILFDLDNTLYDYYSVSNKALDSVYNVLRKRKKISKEKFIRILNQSKKEIREELKHSPDSHDRIVYFQRLGEKINLELKLVLKLYKVYYKYFLKNMKPKKDLVKTFKEIKKRKLKILILTNEVVEIQLKKINKLGVIKYIDYFVASENAGIDKPNKKIFLHALQKIKRKPNEVLMIGDNEKDDIEGAKKVKINTVLLSQKNQKTKADYQIKELSEVLKVIETLNNKR